MQATERFLATLHPRTRESQRQAVLFVLIMSLGLFARVFEWGRLPPGLNADEASIGVEAYNLAHFGVDRNGISYPVHFIAWGSGQNALYGYVLIPFVATLGLSPLVVRLPMLLAGIASLPIFYFVARRTFNGSVGLLAMLLIAISPWHILLSRWALESNLLPFVFLAAYACLLIGVTRRLWFFASCLLCGLAMYAYGTAYAIVPVFMIGVIVIMARSSPLRRLDLALGALVFALVVVPIGLFVIVNSLGLSSIALGPVTIPRLPVQARYEAATVIGQGNLLAGMAANLWAALRLLAAESDGLIYNVVDPFGIFYRVCLPLASVGVVLLSYESRRKMRIEHQLLMAWIGAALVLAILQPVNINRFNIIFMPLLLCSACAVGWLGNRFRPALPASVLLLLVAFAAFTLDYHGTSYRQQISQKFHDGLLPALRYAESKADTTVCVTDEINMPYIFALFSGHTSPADYLGTVRYVDAQAPFRQVVSFDRYVIGTQNCAGRTAVTYVLTTDEIPPRFGNRYSYEFFGNFVVYYPKR